MADCRLLLVGADGRGGGALSLLCPAYGASVPAAMAVPHEVFASYNWDAELSASCCGGGGCGGGGDIQHAGGGAAAAGGAGAAGCGSTAVGGARLSQLPPRVRARSRCVQEPRPQVAPRRARDACGKSDAGETGQPTCRMLLSNWPTPCVAAAAAGTAVGGWLMLLLQTRW